MLRTFCGFLISALLCCLSAQPARLSVDDLYQDLSLSPPELGVHMFLSHAGRVQFTKPKDRVLILEQAFSQAAQSKSGHFPVVALWPTFDSVQGSAAAAYGMGLGRLTLQTEILERLGNLDPHLASERFLEIPLPEPLVYPCSLRRVSDFKPYFVSALRFTKQSPDPFVYAGTLLERVKSSAQLLPFLEYIESVPVSEEARESLMQRLIGKIPSLQLDSRALFREIEALSRRLRSSLRVDQFTRVSGVLEGWLRQPWCTPSGPSSYPDEPRQIEVWKIFFPEATSLQKWPQNHELRWDTTANEDLDFWLDADSKALFEAKERLRDRGDFGDPSGIWAERFLRTLRQIVEAKRPRRLNPIVWYLQKQSLLSDLATFRNYDNLWYMQHPKATKPERQEGYPKVVESLVAHEALLQTMASEDGEVVKNQNPALWLMGLARSTVSIRALPPELQQRFVELIRKTNPNSPALLPYFESLKN